MKLNTFILLLTLLLSCKEYQTFKLVEYDVKRLDLAKPQSIFYSVWDTAYFLATQDGIIAKLDTNFNVLAKREFYNESFQYIYADEVFVYAISEKELITLLKNNFEVKNKVTLAKLGLKQYRIVGFYFNTLSKTFDFVVSKTKLSNFQYNPTNFKKVKTQRIGQGAQVENAFQFSKYLLLIDNEKKTIQVCDISQNFSVSKTFKFIGTDFSSGTFFNPNTLVLLSGETRRVFKYHINLK
jgi:hypothetical protein